MITLLYVQYSALLAQGNLHQQSSVYEWPKDTAVSKKLEKWRDQKFGIIIHWGLYAVPGVIESWALCSEHWIERDSTIGYDQFKQWYWGLQDKFNPVDFDPQQWAKAAREAGMRYLIFTTKHHDGFNMFDTQETNFKITSGPFANHPRANVTKHVFDAFRNEDFMIGAYFSKPDWHSEYYWWPKYATANRNNNYDIKKYSWRWKKYKQFTHNQIKELMTGYGTIDILWLDGGWVRPLETVNDEVRSWGAEIPKWSQDIDMPAVAKMSRSTQPGLLIVDRTVHGPYENYQTPEQQIPKEKLDYPWESCITLGNAWGYVPNDQFKSSTKIIHTLIEITAKGGSLLLGVGPDAKGTLSESQVSRLQEVGVWLKRNGRAIYETRTVDLYQNNTTFFTKGKDLEKMYALVCLKENQQIPKVIEWIGNVPRKGSVVTLLETGKSVRWVAEGDKVKITTPSSLIGQNTAALAFEYETQK
jgi:alpha-L-fucosidase